MPVLVTASGAEPELGLHLQELLDGCYRGADGGSDADTMLATELFLVEGVSGPSQGVEVGLALGAGHHAILLQ